jgi:hypothetical protein
MGSVRRATPPGRRVGGSPVSLLCIC